MEKWITFNGTSEFIKNTYADTADLYITVAPMSVFGTNLTDEQYQVLRRCFSGFKGNIHLCIPESAPRKWVRLLVLCKTVFINEHSYIAPESGFIDGMAPTMEIAIDFFVAILNAKGEDTTGFQALKQNMKQQLERQGKVCFIKDLTQEGLKNIVVGMPSGFNGNFKPARRLIDCYPPLKNVCPCDDSTEDEYDSGCLCNPCKCDPCQCK